MRISVRFSKQLLWLLIFAFAQSRALKLLQDVATRCSFGINYNSVIAQHTTELMMGRRSKGRETKKSKYTKSNLPVKVCVVCGRPFEWRKKWQDVWDEVKYCSERCRRSKSNAQLSVTSSPFDAWLLVRRYNVALFIALLSFNLNTPVSRNQQSTGPLVSIMRPADAVAAISVPTKQELDEVFNGQGWNFAKNEEFNRDEFRRLDESDDSRFYTEPRFVEHVDAAAVDALIKFHGQQLQEVARLQRRAIDVLDLCSSWVSHVPDSVPTRAFAGLGMNMEELQKNSRLTARSVQDLNLNSKLPYSSDSFDVVLIQLSIDYLTNPVDVIQEISRVLRSNGKLIITFSNRVFIDKAVAGWTGKADIDHIERVGRYIYCANHLPRSAGAKQFNEESLSAINLLRNKNTGDPLYAVTATIQ